MQKMQQNPNVWSVESGNWKNRWELNVEIINRNEMLMRIFCDSYKILKADSQQFKPLDCVIRARDKFIPPYACKTRIWLLPVVLIWVYTKTSKLSSFSSGKLRGP